MRPTTVPFDPPEITKNHYTTTKNHHIHHTMSSRGPSIAPRTSLAPSPAGAGSALSPESALPGTVTSIVTSKEWVLPPRPKPGRKPSVDTPASKRKAQNRAAQRAFRERRATRVQELEQKLLEVEKEKEVKEMGLVNTINKLKFENQFLIKLIDQLRLEFSSLRAAVGSAAPSPQALAAPSIPYKSEAYKSENPYKSELSQSAQHLLNFAKLLPINHSTGLPALLLYSVQQILPAPLADSPPVAPHMRTQLAKPTQITPPSHNPSPHKHAKGTDDFDCGVCLKEQCLCEDVGLKLRSLEESYSSFTPMAAVSLKRKRKKSAGAVEVDFTAEFSFKKMPDLKRLRKDSVERSLIKKEAVSPFNEESPVENCGFCSDDTPCVCREAAKEAARINESLAQQHQRPREEEEDEAGPTLLPPIQVNSSSHARQQSLPVMHPGPTLEIREFANMSTTNVPSVVAQSEQEPAQELKGGCTGNPGACTQCQTDPMSTLFCTTVASKAAQEKEPADSPQSTSQRPSASEPASREGSTPAVSTPAVTTPSTPLPSTPGGSTNGIFIPCADAYKTLSRHKRFNSVDFSSLVGRLTTRGMLVEVQSVANVIRELDKKVYD